MPIWLASPPGELGSASTSAHMSAHPNKHCASSRAVTTPETVEGERAVGFVAQDKASLASLQTNAFAGAERRLTIRLEDYWLSLRRYPQGKGPFIDDFQPDRNPVPWRNCFIAYISGRGAEPIFDYVGASIILLFKPDRTNLPDWEWLVDIVAVRFGDMGEMLESFRPTKREGSFERSNGIVALYRSILLPFVDDKREPRYVLGAVSYLLGDAVAA